MTNLRMLSDRRWQGDDRRKDKWANSGTLIHLGKEGGLPLEWPTSILVISLLKRQKKIVPHGIRLVAKPRERGEFIEGITKVLITKIAILETMQSLI